MKAHFLLHMHLKTQPSKQDVHTGSNRLFNSDELTRKGLTHRGSTVNNMSSFYLLIVVILSVLSSLRASPIPECEDVHLICNNSFHDTIAEESFNILHEETLSRHCQDIIEDIECKKNYLSKCDPTGYEAFSLATDGITEVLTELCNGTSALRKVYSMHSLCIANTSDAYENCILDTAEKVSDYDSNNGGSDFYEDDDVASPDNMRRRMCLFYEPFKSCVTRETRKSCGASAAQLVEEIIVRMADKAIRAKC